MKNRNNKNNIPDWSFQDDAVNNILKDFKDNAISRNLLVIPTGGGKTLTAIKVISKMVDKGFLDKNKRVLWVVHTKALKDQAIGERDSQDNIDKFRLNSELSKVLEIEMKIKSVSILNSSSGIEYKLIVIDEAHHSTAKTYQEFFEKRIGILGLTATPTRTDSVELDFDKISYSITFRELEKKGVILKPKFLTSKTDFRIDIGSLSYSDDSNELDKFNFEERNRFIAEIIFKNKNRFKKVIIFAGTNDHAQKIYEEIRIQNKRKGSPYEHIGYIFGADHNEKNINNKDYLKEHKKINTSVLVNCQLLNEGYDDPSIDTVIMATPTNSILYYMQCVGRVVRNFSKDNFRDTYVVEVVDKLPNISYRIDNRWLYADISDYLEPEIIDEKVVDYNQYRKRVVEILKKYKTREEYYKSIPNNKNFEGNSFLLFHGSPDADSHWRPFFITDDNRMKYVPLFNNLSNNIEKYKKIDSEYLLFDKLKISKDDQYFSIRDFRVGIMESLKRAYMKKNKQERVDCLKYITFTKKKLNILQKIVYLIKSVINKMLTNN